ncbi:hypothetical protein PO25_00480 [Vibrio anguillarum]|uniref:hypothetical protein n=1 Tax=Vibrio anguillarum TaxID=55601 RepID=UPI00097E2353|nr:hypothetical protein [Vibrio anguillarum]MBT2946346.1 hypothetical protein [Vibrio anguillarum]
MRDDFTQKTKLALQLRVGNCCSNPSCLRKTTGPNSDCSKASSIGVACHITAASIGGPRYDKRLSSDERKSVLNGIWLCESCAKMIDVDVDEFPVELLYFWKTRAEAIAKYEYEGKETPPELLYEGYTCPICGTFVKDGLTVCLGCKADICYGLTPKEKMESATTWGCLGLFVGMLVFLVLPQILRSSFGWSIPEFWGIGIYAIAITLISSFALMVFVPDLEDRDRLKLPPRFFKARSY